MRRWDAAEERSGICISVKVSKRKGSEFGVPDAFIVIPSGLSGIACTIDRTAEML